MQITKHFTLEEFERSATAERQHIDNHAPEALIPNIRYLCEQVLEPLREAFDTPVIITSGYRSPPLNAAVGGVKNSQHQYGEAADIRPREGALLAWYKWIMDNCPFDQLFLERDSKGNTWIHVSIRRDGKNRQTAGRLRKR